jgi:hypothetical protein
VKGAYARRSKIKFLVLFFYHAHRYTLNPCDTQLWNKLDKKLPQFELGNRSIPILLIVAKKNPANSEA